MNSYNALRQQHKPAHVKVLLIAESPPPAAAVNSSRHFYRSDKQRKDDRLFSNTMRTLYADAAKASEAELEQQKEYWLRRFQADGWYMIEALETSQPHHVSKGQRQQRIHSNLPRLIERIKEIASADTKIILIKSNVFEVAAEPLRNAGFAVLNTELVDYPGQYNQRAYREKLSKLASASSTKGNNPAS